MSAKTKRPRRAGAGRVSDKQRAADDRLRDELRRADLKKFDRVLGKAIQPHDK